MKRTRSFIQGEAAAADSKKGYSSYRPQEQSRRQSYDHGSNRNKNYRSEGGGRGNDKYTPLTKTPREIFATEGANFPRPPPMRTPEGQRQGNGYYEYHGQKGHDSLCFGEWKNNLSIYQHVTPPKFDTADDLQAL